MIPRPLTDVYAVVMTHFCVPRTRKPKALVVVLGGVRPDCLEREQKARFLAEVGGTLSAAYTGGVRGTATQQATDAAAGWAALLTGRWGKDSGILDNTSLRKHPEVPSFLQTLGSRGYSVASLSSESRLHVVILRDEALDYRFSPDRDGDDESVLAEARSVLERDFDAVLVGLQGPQDEGLRSGFSPDNPAYGQSVARAFAQTRQLCDTVRARRASNEDWLVVVTTNHGGLDKDHGGQSNAERAVFLIEGLITA